MIKIDLLKNHPNAIPALSRIWYETIGKIWLPELGIEEIEALSYKELKSDEQITYIALDGEIPIGFCTFGLEEGFRPDLGPWISDLVVELKYQKQGIGKMLLEYTLEKVKELGFSEIYLFTFDLTIPKYYERLGWKIMETDEFKERPVTIMELSL